MKTDGGTQIERIDATAEIEPNVEHGHTTESVMRELREQGFEPVETGNGKIKVVLATGDQCSNCKHWLKRGETPMVYGWCRRFPPVANDPTKLAVYPITPNTWLCGEYGPVRPRPE